MTDIIGPDQGNSPTNNSTEQSLEKLLEELGKARKNFGYPIIVAFDRKTANHVLKQEFIERYSGGLFLDPMNSEVDLEPGVSYHQLNDFCLDEPRLSFENADLSDSKAALMMRTVRGKQLQLTQATGSTHRRVTRLAEATPVNGPSLVFDIELQNTYGEISDEGRVYFQFTAGKNYAFYGGVTQFEIDKLGQHFKQYFEGMSIDPGGRAKIEYTLGRIAATESSALKPHKFAIRTHGALGSTPRNTENFADGAVVLFIELEGFDSGAAVPPDENRKLPYLLPVDHSANMLVNTDFLGLAIVGSAIKKLDNRFQLEFKVSPGEKFIYYAEGKVQFDGIYLSNGSASLTAREPDWYSPSLFDENNGFFLKIVNNSITVEFKANATLTFDFLKDNKPDTATASPSWRFSQHYTFEVDDTGSGSKIKLVKTGKLEYAFTPNLSSKLKDYIWIGQLQEKELIDQLTRSIFSAFNRMYNFMTTLDMEIDTFVMSSLLFRNSQIRIDSLHQPNDFITPGQLAPDRNTFIIARRDSTPIDNGETSTLPGKSISFKTVPLVEGVVWSVRHLPDYTGDDLKGEINENTGIYTAPAADKFKGSHTKVIVTAQKGTEVSHALVSVLRTSVSIYPSIATVNLNAYTDIIAGEMNGNAITWKVEGLGSFRARPKNDPLAQANNRYYAPDPLQVPKWDESMPVVDQVMRHSKVVVSSGNSQKVVDILLPLEIEGAYWLVAKAHDKGVKFEFWVRNKGGEELQVPEEQTSWHVRVGNGTIEKGIYTPDPNKTEEYAVIVAMDENSFIPAYASMILPLPFIDVKQFLALHAPDEAKVIANQ